MKELLRQALTHLGAEVQDEERALLASLPEGDQGPGPELARRLGQRQLRLVFDSRDVAPGSDLVAPGSHLLRALDELLGRHGVRAYVERPAGHKLTLAALKAVLEPARGLRLSIAAREAECGWDVWVVYRVRYHTRERTDTLETVQVALRPGAAPRVEAGEPPAGFEAWVAAPRKRVPDELLLPALAAADELVLERARLEAARIGEEARQRLQRDAGRMQAYYAAQLAELSRGRRRRDGDEQKAEELEEERELRLRELQLSAEVRVEVEPLQLLTVEVPLTRARAQVRPARTRERDPDEPETAEPEEGAPEPAGQEPPGLPVLFDRSTGEVALAPCQACGESLVRAKVATCEAGHVAHQACVKTCAACRRGLCAACQGGACDVCQRRLCATCLAPCRACERPTCVEHRAACAVCAQEGCARCLPACAHCGAPACEGHRHAAAEGAPAPFCVRCAQPCPGCHTVTPEAEQGRCPRCGRRFCRGCLPAGAEACALCRA